MILGELALKEKKVDLFDVYDLEKCYCDFFEEVLEDSSGKYNRNALKSLGVNSAQCSKNVMNLHRLSLLKEYRKIGLGRSVLRAILTRYSLGAGIAAVSPTPFSFTEANIVDGNIPWDDVGWDDEWNEWVDVDVCCSRLHQPLVNYFAEFGFKPVAGSRYMIAKL